MEKKENQGPFHSLTKPSTSVQAQADDSGK
jgi:hypothetical protein